MSLEIRTAAPGIGDVVLGRTLPSLLDDAVARFPNPKGFNQPTPEGGWLTFSNGDFRTAADEVALGLAEHGVTRGDRLAFFLNGGVYFAMLDFGTLVAGVVNVPLYTTADRENLVYVTRHSEARAMAVSNAEMLARFAAWAADVPDVRLVILTEGDGGGVTLPEGIELVTLDALRAKGRARLARDPDEPRRMREALDPQGLASLIYTSGTTGQPKGVMLSLENISSNVFAAFTSIELLGHQDEVALSFLPLTHIYARMLQFAHVAWGHQLYYSDPDRLVAHLTEVRPTVFAAVPRVLEKVFDRVLLGVQQSTGLKHRIGSWALALAKTYETGTEPTGLRAAQFGLADKLVYSKLRERLGLTRIKALSVGGAALRPDLANAFNAFGIPVLEGYGLTETSPVIATSIPRLSRAGAVGPPIPGIEVAIADDGEILTRGPHVMLGYYKQPEQTAEVMDADGWFHTGDIGRFTADGCLKITDRKKALFKLSTGKYVIPQPIENKLTESPLIEQAVVMGSGYPFCSALLFPSLDSLKHWATQNDVDAEQPAEALLRAPKVVREFERLVAEANRGMDHWSQVKRFRLIPELMTVENEMLTPKMSVKRAKVGEAFEGEVERMYDEAAAERGGVAAVA